MLLSEKKICMVLLLLCHFGSSMAQDTLTQQTLKEISVEAKSQHSATSSQTPLQIIDKQKIEQINAWQLSDIAKQLLGVVLKDYGGIGGIKTISARGLGSQFSTLSIDGFAVGDCQNGQPDVGRFVVANVEQISFANGQIDDIFQPARLLAAGNVLNIQTARPQFNNKKTNLKIALDVGSFALFNPSLIIEQKISPKIDISLQANYIQSDGDYPYTVYYTNNKKDSNATFKRQHSAVKRTNIEANLFYNITQNQYFTTKIHYYNAIQELPGPVIFYKENLGSENTWDQAALLQIHYLNKITEKLHFQINGKLYTTSNIYEDTAYQNSAGFLHHHFRQSEYYVAGTLLARPIHWLKISYATDYFYNKLKSNIEQSAEVARHSWLNALSGNLCFEHVNISATALYSLYSEDVLNEFSKAYYHFTPYFGISYKPFKNIDLRFRYFIKQNYRLPNFNECYYTALSRKLKPEKALQNNVGIIFDTKIENKHRHKLSFSLDAYYNRVNNKIIAIPRQSLYLWSMQNIGLVSIAGIEARANMCFGLAQSVQMEINMNYTYQQAIDITDKKSKTYNQQIPYTPRHSATAELFLSSKIVDFGYNIIFVGNRYSFAQNTANNLVKWYVDQGLTISKVLDLKKGYLKLLGQILNLFNVQYEIVNSYPMMGRNYKLKILYNF